LTGATVGTLVSLLPANARDDGKNGVVAVGALAGATAGLITQLFLNHHLDPRKGRAGLSLAVQPSRGLSLGLVYRF
ncbi:MAG: hypothetical protein HKO65_01780, partial [Gemmatimonadetes bacterium]|nr:hypothetical protein [Gemmatimonadota bacterium]